MRFTAAAVAALFGAAVAVPTPQNQDKVYETVTVKDLFAHKSVVAGTTDGPVDSLTFNIIASREEGTIGVVCEGQEEEGGIKYAPDYYICNGGTDIVKYSFNVKSISDNGTFKITLFHQTGIAFGYWAETNIPTYCRAGGNNSLVCSQIADVEVGLHL
ncbi:hypothetical protein B0I37DRAFT_449535 [Chaetomium sp. MPI-CAGE-AT-0009]|nr:hypothetical protein B0I37DRAFT_449535 [Chaetomium sp. MPI-CAGE-AT-0009]